MYPSRTKYKIIKILNNNVILAFDLEKEKELIIVSKGIGFGNRRDDILKLARNQIEKMFIIYDNKMQSQYYELIDLLDEDVIAVSEEIINLGERNLGSLNPHIHMALTDHIGFSIERLKQGIEINNPFLNEIRFLYPEEYKLGVEAGKLIKKVFDVNIPDSEVGFIALHLHSARQNREVEETVRYTSMIRKLIDIVENELEIDLESTDLGYIRLINHLRFVIDRLEKGKNEKNPIINNIKTEYKESFEISKKIGRYIEDSLNIPISEDELGYITIHIQRIKLNIKG